jgi:hypothetical protein
MCWDKDGVLSSHTPKYEMTTSSSKPCGERRILTEPHDFCFGGVQNKVKGRVSLLDTALL